MIRPRALFLALFIAAIAVGVRFLGNLPPPDGDAWAQVSSCGNAIIEPGEQCDPPGSLSCPLPGSPSGALPCNDDCTCPTVVTTTSSTTTTTLPLPDHFQCYELKRGTFVNVPRTVQDQFGTLNVTLRYPGKLCAPANKNGEGITDETDHLVAFREKASARFNPVRNQTITDQFGTVVVDVLRPESLLVPTSKDGVAQTPPLDHFQCYKVKRSKGAAKFVPHTVSIVDQIESTSVTLTKPRALCAPANKNGEDPTAPTHPGHLICYKTKGSRFTQQIHTVTNQLQTNASVRLIRRIEFCVPALKNAGTTTTSTTIVVTTSTTSTSTSSSTSTSTSTSASTSSTTSTTLYGSPSRAFLQRPRSLLD
jgi:hypothetical protein